MDLDPRPECFCPRSSAEKKSFLLNACKTMPEAMIHLMFAPVVDDYVQPAL